MKYNILLFLFVFIFVSCDKDKIDTNEKSYLGKFEYDANSSEIDFSLLDDSKTLRYLESEGRSDLSISLGNSFVVHRSPDPLLLIAPETKAAENFNFNVFSKQVGSDALTTINSITLDDLVDGGQRFRIKTSELYGKEIVIKAEHKTDATKNFTVKNYIPQKFEFSTVPKEGTFNVSKNAGYKLEWNRDESNTQGVVIQITADNSFKANEPNFQLERKFFTILTKDDGSYDITPEQLQRFDNGWVEIWVTRGVLDAQYVEGLTKHIGVRMLQTVRMGALLDNE